MTDFSARARAPFYSCACRLSARRRYRLCAVFIAGGLISAPPAAAAEAGQDDIVVSATRSARAPAEIGSTVAVIDAAEIAARQYAFVADALRDAAGVAVARNGALGGFAGARIRGATSGQTLVVIDGAVVNDPAAPQGGFNFANLDVADIERIEILRGPQSILYGADAIGGVIAITTRGASDRAGAFIEGGASGLVRGGATLGIAGADAFGRLTVSGVRTAGISRAAVGTEDDGYRSLAASLRAGARLSAGVDAEISARFSDSRAEIDGFPPPAFALDDTAETEDTEERALSTRLLHGGFGGAFGRKSGSPRRDFSGALTLAWSAIERLNEDAGSATFAAKGDRLAVDYVGDLRLSERFSLIGGAEAERMSVDVSGVDDEARSAGVFALVEAKPIDGLTISAGGRRDEFSNFKGATTARVAAAYAIGAGTILRASWGEGYRAPTLFELNFDQFGIVPNPDLAPERSSGFDAGIEHAFGDPGAPALVARATFFHSRVADQIDFDFAANGYVNIARTRARGVEVEAQWTPDRQFGASLAYAYLDAVDAATGAQLLRQPRHKATAVLSLQPTGRLSVSTSVIFNGPEPDFPTPNDGFVRVDVRAAYAISDAISLYARVENALDADYQDVSGYGEAGASLIAGARLGL